MSKESNLNNFYSNLTSEYWNHSINLSNDKDMKIKVSEIGPIFATLEINRIYGYNPVNIEMCDSRVYGLLEIQFSKIIKLFSNVKIFGIFSLLLKYILSARNVSNTMKMMFALVILKSE